MPDASVSYLNGLMGIRFSCHSCGKSLNIKIELAGRRGVCPECQTRFRIPVRDTEYSTPIEANTEVAGAGVGASSGGQVATATASPSAAVAVSNPGSSQAGSPTASGQVAGDPAIDLIDSEPAATWYVRPPSGGQYGPADAQVLRGWIAEGRVARTALLWREGWPQWREAAEVLPEIAETLPGPLLQTLSDPLADSVDTKKTTPVARESTRPIGGGFAGDAKIGATRRKRTSRRMTLVAVLAVLVVGLIITLIIVSVARNQSTSQRESGTDVSRGRVTANIREN